VKRQTDRQFGLMFAVVFCIIAGVAWFVFDAWLAWALGAAAAFAALALTAPGVLMPLNRLWMAFAHRLGGFSNFIVLGLFFYVFVMPFGLMMRAFGWDPMTRRPDTRVASYWTPVGRQANAETFPDMF